jgi:hypothetical protein
MGDVTALVKGIDDRFAIFGSGEEIAAEFDANEAAGAACALEARLLLLCERICEGYGLVGCFAVYGGATAVPWDEHVSVSGEREFPDDADALKYQLNWNDRWDSGEPVRSYRFDYREMPSTPSRMTLPHPELRSRDDKFSTTDFGAKGQVLRPQ